MKEINENELKDVTGGSGPAKVVGIDDGIVSLCPEGYVLKDGKCMLEEEFVIKSFKKKTDLKIIPR